MNDLTSQRHLARARVVDLVERFRRNEADYLRADYNETQARTDFITPLLEAFGWDVHNTAGHPTGFRDVIEEATVEVGAERMSKRPDYELRLARQRKLFVEAKKPSVPIDRQRDAAFQTRRYGFSASLPISVLTNFHQLAVYDCHHVPNETDEAHVARVLLVRYDEFEAHFDELWDLFSRETVYSGAFDRRFEVYTPRHGTAQFDRLFLEQVRSWRARLAADIHANTPGISPAELTYAVQIFLSRIVFLRICEDREIEQYETLRKLPPENTFAALSAQLKSSDNFYNSGLFCLLNDSRLGIRVSDRLLHNIITELYYPNSPYTFAAVETEMLGEIYDQFLGEEIQVGAGGVVIVSKPEVRESGGVFPTPRYIVDDIVERTLLPALAGKDPAALAGFTVADICCGSGIFLLAAYELILGHYLSWYLDNARATHLGREIYDAGAGQWRLTFREKRRILLEHIRGVDIDANAVEVARFSLLLKLLEGESADSLRDYVRETHSPALPSLDAIVKSGNSLVSPREWTLSCGTIPLPLVASINPFAWEIEFEQEMARGGFDVIVGNPPYIRIQGMAVYSPAEVAFYQKGNSPYQTAHQDNFDKYALFIERSVALLAPTGKLGVIVPHKFMTTQAGHALRELITTAGLLEEVVHFGVKQVFGPKVSNYTCILVLGRTRAATVRVEKVDDLDTWRYGVAGSVSTVPAESLGADNWQFADEETQALFARVRAAHRKRLQDVAEIFVGVQTSADDIYIFQPQGQSGDTVTLHWDGRDWPIERAVLRPCLLDVKLDSYAKPVANSWMIFPYHIAEENGTDKASLIQPDEMASRFPHCWEYLNARRDRLEKRQITGGKASQRQFYQFGRSQSLTKFNTPKIILPILSKAARYAYDDANTVVTGGGNGPYYMVRALASADLSDFYLLAVLSHPLSEAFVRTNTSPFRGGYYSHGKQFIENLPVPIPAPAQQAAIEEAVKEIIATQDLLATARIPHQCTLYERRIAALKADVERLVSELFGLSDEDMAVARAVPVPS